jgi:hypothetical protein
MTLLVPIMMFGWIPIVVGLFSKLPPRRAVITSFLFAWLFLPMASYHVTGFPAYTKMSATCCGVFIGAAIFDYKRIVSFRPKLIDLPTIIWCLCPFISSLTNGLGIHDGFSAVFVQTVTWGFPYIIGRLYFTDLESLNEFAIGIFIGGLIYMPLCLYEIRMSPQLHSMFYGFTQHSFAQTIRSGGYRPMVFMEHGLMVGIWMISSSFIGVCLWVSGPLKKIWNIPMVWLVGPLIFTSILCKSTGAILLLIAGIGIFYATRKFSTKSLILILLLIPAVYLPLRASGTWNGYGLTNFIYSNFSRERALSLYTRFYNENALSGKALEKPLFGWGRWGRSRIYDENGGDTSITDSLWVITLGENGLTGLISLTLSLLLPIVILLRLYDIKDWFRPEIAAASSLAILLGIYMIDNLVNAMTNPIFMVTAGGIISIVKQPVMTSKFPTECIETIRVRPAFQPRFL